MPEGQIPLIERPQFIALNKIDVPEGRDLAALVRPDLEARGYRVFDISTVSHEGLRQLSFALAELVAEDRAKRAAEPVQQRIVIRPRAVNETGFAIKVEGGSGGNIYRILGAKPERWVAQTDFTNEEAIGYLADRLAKLGIENELFKVGAIAGSTVVIGPGHGIVFDWEPTLTSAAELATAPRGTDPRLIENQRPTHGKRRESYLERMDAKTAAREELLRERKAGMWQGDEGFEIVRDSGDMLQIPDVTTRKVTTRATPGHPVTDLPDLTDVSVPFPAVPEAGVVADAHRITRREQIPAARRVVVKVGSSSISGENAGQIAPLVDALAAAHARGSEVILVSSGAIATGMPYLQLDSRPTDLATQQAAAAVGQNVLIYRYQDSLDRYEIVAGQVLLTAGDLENPAHRSNAQRAMDRLLGLRILPIVNENDTVATHEIRFGDNDRLAALVAQLVRADVLVLLSDVDALYTKPPAAPGATAITTVPFGDPLSGIEFGDIGAAGVGTGGAGTKVAAARLAASSGTPVLLAATSQVAQALSGSDIGTWFEASPSGHPR